MPTQLDAKTLSLAVAPALQRWIHEKYEPFLQRSSPGQLTDEWFRWFLGQWNVARTIRTGSREPVRHYLDVEFRQAVVGESFPSAVDDATTHIQRQRWSAKGRRPISLVSKIGFFLRPSKFVPMDQYAFAGLNAMRHLSGKSNLKGQLYRDYLQAFDDEYTAVETQLRDVLRQDWVVTFANKLGCPATVLNSTALHRKLFDNYLMRTGGYVPSW